MKILRVRWSFAAAFVLVPLVIGCGGGGGSNGAGCAAPTFTNLTGVWSITENPSSNCGDDVQELYDFTMTQNGSAIVIVDSDDVNHAGTVCGNQIIANVPIVVPDGAGTTTITSYVITLNSATSGTLSAVWSYSEPGFACAGTSSGTAIKN